MEYISKFFNSFKFDFERVNVILGANGSGKSKLLREIRDNVFHSGQHPVFIEGGRTIIIHDVLQLDMHNFQQYQRLTEAEQNYENKRSQSLANRVFDALIILDQKEQVIKTKHSDAVEQWNQSGRQGGYPVRSLVPLKKLFQMFSEIFPLIELDYDTTKKQLIAKKNGASYGPSSFSDGEKQVFSILADFIDLGDQHKIIIADEPELNLHPELAERVWTLIENEFSDKVFIYATHSISFALRKNVNEVFVLSNDSAKISKFVDLESLPRPETMAFLGGLPGILSANKVIVTEGHEKSFDAIFYRWLLSDPLIEIFAAGACQDVVSVVTRSGLWKKIASQISLCGVIDSDFRDLKYNSSLASQNVYVLDLHEAESYLCLPEVICAISKKIGSQEKILEQKDVIAMICSSLNEQMYQIIAKRLFNRKKTTLAISINRKALSEIRTKEGLLNKIDKSIDEETAKIDSSISHDTIEKEIDEEAHVIQEYCNDKNFLACLKMLPGKEMLNRIAPLAGCKSSTDLMRAVKTNLHAEDFSELFQLKSKLLKMIEA